MAISSRAGSPIERKRAGAAIEWASDGPWFRVDRQFMDFRSGDEAIKALHRRRLNHLIRNIGPRQWPAGLRDNAVELDRKVAVMIR